ncbi:hypothetical protein AVEN_73077-1 [Araneus ventricosus]|uniref:Uncharacterized protein n=1 Tax=Araneus ventricosus TaxID=182803 RepID=A0A4Y2TY06_ARAVE|nr:hypothetical protein AVEN_73077-1 [Araneus ventricosus]
MNDRPTRQDRHRDLRVIALIEIPIPRLPFYRDRYRSPSSWHPMGRKMQRIPLPSILSMDLLPSFQHQAVLFYIPKWLWKENLLGRQDDERTTTKDLGPCFQTRN